MAGIENVCRGNAGPVHRDTLVQREEWIFSMVPDRPLGVSLFVVRLVLEKKQRRKASEEKIGG
jgi:hypothetical protein